MTSRCVSCIRAVEEPKTRISISVEFNNPANDPPSLPVSAIIFKSLLCAASQALNMLSELPLVVINSKVSPA